MNASEHITSCIDIRERDRLNAPALRDLVRAAVALNSGKQGKR